MDWPRCWSCSKKRREGAAAMKMMNVMNAGGRGSPKGAPRSTAGGFHCWLRAFGAARMPQ